MSAPTLEKSMADFIGIFQNGAVHDAAPNLEFPAYPWKHLVVRTHPWRKQLYLRGRNMTARQLVGGVKANGLTVLEAAKNYDLPEAAIQEALEYVEMNRELVEFETSYEKYLLEKQD